MPKVYVTKSSKKLHYEGGCQFAEPKPTDTEIFETQDAAIQKYGNSLSICKNCSKKFNNLKSL